MTFKTLMVELTVGQPNVKLLAIAKDLAHRLEAVVIGVAACQPMAMAYGDGYYSGEAFQDDRIELEEALKTAEAEFRSAFSENSFGGSSTCPGWHAAVVFDTVADYVCRRACEADLIVTAASPPTSPPSTRSADITQLLMEAGRPILLLPQECGVLSLDEVLVAWKDTRETRRAIADAIPILQLAGNVTLAQFVPVKDLARASDRLEPVARWLRGHNVLPSCLTLPTVGDDAGSLSALIEARQISLVVAGAYGHSRFREWVLGGVTRDLLLHKSHASLLSR